MFMHAFRYVDQFCRCPKIHNNKKNEILSFGALSQVPKSILIHAHYKFMTFSLKFECFSFLSSSSVSNACGLCMLIVCMGIFACLSMFVLCFDIIVVRCIVSLGNKNVRIMLLLLLY